MTTILIILGVLGAAAFAMTIIMTRMIYICPPSEVLIFSGGHREIGSATKAAGKEVGYRVVQGGRGFRIPLLEIVDRMDLTNMVIDLRVAGAYCKGGIPLNVEGVANVKIASTERIMSNAIERLLGKNRADIMMIARETLEGNLRGVLAMLTPEEVNQDRDKFAHELLKEADHDLQKLGLELDTLKIQHVTDDKQFLDSLGRKQSAELIMTSRIAEAENMALTAEREAHNIQIQEMAKVDALIAVAHADANRRVVDAETRGAAMVAEERATVVAAIARAEAEVGVQKARIGQVRLQLEADQIKPAEAQRTQLLEHARGSSARIIEEGKATADAMRRVSETWARSGDNARQIFVAQKLSTLIGHMMSTVGEIPVDKVTFIDKKLLNGGNNFAVNAAVTAEQLKQTLGVDVAALLNRVGGGDGPKL